MKKHKIGVSLIGLHLVFSLSMFANNSVYNLKDNFINSKSEVIKLESFKGKKTLMVLVYTSCEYACPLLVDRMLKVSKIAASKNTNLNYVIISFDGKVDTADVLARFAKNKKLTMKNWTLLTSKDISVRKLAAILGVSYKKLSNGAWSHSNIIHLLDERGLIINQLKGLSSPIESIIKNI